MGSPEYVYIYYTLMPSGERTTTPWLHDEDTMLLPMEEADRRMAFTALKQVRICLSCSYMINFEMFKGVLHPEFFFLNINFFHSLKLKYVHIHTLGRDI